MSPDNLSPNIIWITLESIRADHTPMQGYHKNTTPKLHQISELTKGSYFKNCFSHGIFTASSSASILTGTYASRHGVGLSNEVLPKELDTIADLLSENGYYTFAFNGNAQLGPERGLDRGFDDYVYFRPKTIIRDLGPRAFLKYVLNIRSRGGGFSLNQAHHGAAYMMTDIIKRKIQSSARSESPFFCYTHFPDSHHPFTPPLPYLEEMIDDVPVSAREARDISINTSNNLYEIIANDCPLSDREVKAIQAAYDGEIKHIDQCIGEIFNFVQSLNNDRDTIFVIVSDHGELFGKMGLLAHKFIVHDDLTHIPAVTYGLNGIEQQTDNIIQPIDLVYTLLSQVNANLSQLQGIDLRSEQRNFAVSERSGENTKKQLSRLEDHNPGFDVSQFHQTTVRSLRNHQYRYIHTENGHELFKIGAEGNDISDEHPDVIEEFKSMYQNWKKQYGNLAGEGKGELSEDAKQQLEAMGYIA